MYYYYNALAKLFCCNLVSKAGDDASVRGYHKNLLFYCQPTCLRKIHGCDFIFQEIKRTSMKHMTPNYSQYIQCLIKVRAPSSVVRGQIAEMETYTMPLCGTYEDVPRMITSRSESRTKVAHDPHRASGSGSSSHHRRRSSRKKGLATFFKNMWDMCCNTYDVVHKILEMSQETCRRQNELLAARGSVVPPIGTELDAVPYVNYVMLPLDEDMFHGFENFVLSPHVSDDVDEDEDDANVDEEDGSQTVCSPRAPSDNF
jgi:hypothetical protein